MHISSIQRLWHNLRLGKIIPIVLPALVVFLLLVVVVRLQVSVENALANITVNIPFLFAFIAGLVASVNPCGFVMLPTYISYHLGTNEEGFSSRSFIDRASRGLMLGIAATTGFVLVAAVVGLVVSFGGQWLTRTFRFFGPVLGVVLLGLGLFLLIRRSQLKLISASRVYVSPKRNIGNVVAFGAAYSISSLSCTLPIFLAVVGIGLGSEGIARSFAQFMGYALGMGAVLVSMTMGAALFRERLISWMRGSVLVMARTSSLFLIGAGCYLLYYWVVIVNSLNLFSNVAHGSFSLG